MRGPTGKCTGHQALQVKEQEASQKAPPLSNEAPKEGAPAQVAQHEKRKNTRTPDDAVQETQQDDEAPEQKEPPALQMTGRHGQTLGLVQRLGGLGEAVVGKIGHGVLVGMVAIESKDQFFRNTANGGIGHTAASIPRLSLV